MKTIKAKETEVVEREGYGYKILPKLNLIEEDIIKFDENHKRYKKLVQEILESYPLSTNNDFVLYFETLRVLELLEVTSGKDNFCFKIRRENIKKIPSPESITRARRSLNNKGIGLPTNLEVFKHRMRRQRTIRQYFHEQKNI